MEENPITLNYICHRINTIVELRLIPSQYGVEIDIRDCGDELILQHDPYVAVGDKLEDYLKEYHHAFIILNIKSEAIEYRILDLLKKYGIQNYFFLDSSFPMIYKLTKLGIKNIALRYSEYESLESILLMKDKCQWVWIDCFTKLPLNNKIYHTLKDNNFKLCIVSPELQGHKDRISEFKQLLMSENITLDFICTKVYNIDKWNN